MPRGKPTDPELIRSVMEHHNTGATQIITAEKFGLTQPQVSNIIRKVAKMNGSEASSEVELEEEIPDQIAALRSFTNKASSSCEDALISWRNVQGETPAEWAILIDAAEKASIAWKKAALELTRKQELTNKARRTR